MYEWYVEYAKKQCLPHILTLVVVVVVELLSFSLSGLFHNMGHCCFQMLLLVISWIEMHSIHLTKSLTI